MAKDLWICERKEHLPEHNGATGYYFYEPIEAYAGWQSIETAPKLGKFLASWHGHKYVYVTYWNEPAQCWQVESFSHMDDEVIDWPTHWMPLPKPPKDGEVK